MDSTEATRRGGQRTRPCAGTADTTKDQEAQEVHQGSTQDTRVPLAVAVRNGIFQGAIAMVKLLTVFTKLFNYGGAPGPTRRRLSRVDKISLSYKRVSHSCNCFF